MRKFVEVDEQHPGRCTKILDLIGQLYEVEVERDAKEKPPDEVAVLRKERSKKITLAIQKWALEVEALSESSLGRVIKYMGSLWDGLCAFLNNPVVDLDNNGTERTLCGVVLDRKNNVGSRSVCGDSVPRASNLPVSARTRTSKTAFEHSPWWGTEGDRLDYLKRQSFEQRLRRSIGPPSFGAEPKESPWRFESNAAATATSSTSVAALSSATAAAATTTTSRAA